MDKDSIKAILFDLDGTIIDTDDEAVEKLARRLRPLLGRRALRLARWLLMRAETPGNAFITLLDWLHLDQPLTTLTDKLRRRRGALPAHEFRLIPGVETAVLHLAQTYRIGIVTTRSRYHIDALLAQYPQLAKVVETSCGLQDTRRL
ncbi:MAG: HAD family hydrolase, partial [Anaerolineae bacterium]